MVCMLKRGTFIFKPIRQLFIKSKVGNVSFFFSVESLGVLVLQKAIQLVLEEIYERKEREFSMYSHGFRFGRSFHTVLKEIKDH